MSVVNIGHVYCLHLQVNCMLQRHELQASGCGGGRCDFDFEHGIQIALFSQ